MGLGALLLWYINKRTLCRGQRKAKSCQRGLIELSIEEFRTKKLLLSVKALVDVLHPR